MAVPDMERRQPVLRIFAYYEKDLVTKGYITVTKVVAKVDKKAAAPAEDSDE